MKVTSFAKATAFVSAAALMASAGLAQAQVTKNDAKCRSAIMKVATKYVATVSKTIDGCQKGQLKAPTGADCNDLAVADAKGKVGKAAAKLTGAVGGAKSKCGIKDPNTLALAQFASCPSPGNAVDDGGATPGIDDFTELGLCELEINKEHTLLARRHMLSPDFTAIALSPRAKEIGKCVGTIGKGVTKLIATVGKTRGKCQATSDKGGGSYSYGCSTDDTKGKIAKAAAKLAAGIDKACGGTKVNLSSEELLLLGGCDDTIAGLKSCLVSSATKAGSGLTATAFEFAGVCPSIVKVNANAGFSGGTRVSQSRLDVGFTGFGINADITEGFTGAVSLACASGDCAACAIDNACASNNCRCSNDVSIECSNPLATDPACGGNLCEVHFGAPLPLSAAGTPTCVLTKIDAPLSGTADAGTGQSNTVVSSKAVVYLGISQARPCPTCDAGVCNGGARNGLACTVDGSHETFGNVSYSCPPDLAQNVTGTGLDIALTFTDAATSLAASTACDFPLGALSCTCAQCSGDTTVACANDAECAAIGAGTCTASTGASRAPSGCAPDPTACGDIGGGQGECPAGPDDSFCSGIVKTNGDGFIPCSSDLECEPLFAGSATCDSVVRRACFLDPITTAGSAGIESAVLGGSFCVPPTANAGVNGAAGTTGPARVVIDWNFTGLCSDGVTEWEFGGSNCP